MSPRATPHEPEFAPVVLACGHVIQGVAHFDTGPPSRVECQEGCGWQEYVIEPAPDEESTR